MRVYLMYLLMLCAGVRNGLCEGDVSCIGSPTTNALALALQAIVLPEVHLVPQDDCIRMRETFPGSTLSNSVAFVLDSVYSNQSCFAIHARNMTALELIDLICYLTDTDYAFKNGTLVMSTNGLKGVRHSLGQNDRRAEKLVEKMKKMVIPEVSFRYPATVLDALEFFHSVSLDYDDEKKGVNIAVQNIQKLLNYRHKNDENHMPIIAMSAKFCTFYEGMSNVCDVIGARIVIRNNTVIFVPQGDDPGRSQ